MAWSAALHIPRHGQVVRCFEDENVVHVAGKVNPVEDTETINFELALSDVQQIEKRMERLKKGKMKTKEEAAKGEVRFLAPFRHCMRTISGIVHAPFLAFWTHPFWHCTRTLSGVLHAPLLAFCTLHCLHSARSIACILHEVWNAALFPPSLLNAQPSCACHSHSG
jgi:hypothetical protein